jgi:DNA repair exonuclease SbcCD nuclease subunit
MKVLIFSDLHVHHYQQFNSDGLRAQRAADMIKYVFKLADANGIEQIWFCGDMGDQFGSITVIAMNALIRAFAYAVEDYPNIEFIAIPGNHDFALKNTPKAPSPSVMDTFPELFTGFNLLGGNFDTRDFSVVGIPFFEDPDDFWSYFDGITAYIANPDNAYLLMHQMVWPENAMVPDDINYLDERFKQFKWVFNGHVHIPSMIGNNFISVGSPMHRDASDVDGKKGMWLLDTDSDDLPGFWDTTEKNPQYIRRPYGHKADEWESEQYIVRFHPEDKKKKVKDKFDSTKFDTNKVQPADMIDPFLKAQESKLELPKADLQRVGTKYFT